MTTETKYRVKIEATIRRSDIDELVEQLQEAFTADGIETEVNTREIYAKSLDPISIIVEVVASYFGIRFFLEPATNKVITAYKQAMAHARQPYRPIHIMIKFGDPEFEIFTVPYILNRDFLLNFFQNTERILDVLYGQQLLSQFRQVRLISKSIDEIVAVCYQADKGPTHLVDIQSGQIRPISYVELSEFSDSPDPAEQFYKYEKLRAKLHSEFLQRLKDQHNATQ